EHGITPATIRKSVRELLVRRAEEKRQTEQSQIEVISQGYNVMIAKDRRRLVSELEKLMLEHARNLEFEEAAVVRDEIDKIKALG
ncbi:MAG: excinuclease ABC subunit B, partial [Spirochaetaceae bacterium]